MHLMKIKIWVTLIFAVFWLKSPAQEAMEKFGKNRLQFKSFDWRYYSTENFDIYFYDGGNELAKIGADYLEEEFDRLTDQLGYAPYSKTEIFLYNSVTDLQQSNMGVNDNSFDVAGKTDFVKSQVELAYPGTAAEFKRVLIYKISGMLITDMMFGGSLSDMFQNSYLLTLPEWFMEGASRYAAYQWDVEMDDFIRDFLVNNKVKSLTKYTGDEAGMIGQSIWNFVSERYGVSSISNILNLTRIIRNEEKSISGTLAIPFKTFIAEWKNYYLSQASFVQENYTLPDYKAKVTNNKKGLKYTDLKISPEGNYLAYAQNYKGKVKIMLREKGKKKEKEIFSSGYRVIDQDYDDGVPLLSWKDENTLGIISTRYGRTYLWVYSVSSKKKTKKELTRINQIRDFDISKGGNLAVISADRNGNSDLYLVSLKRNSIKRITNDFYDDINPRFIPGTSSIVFSSNRTTDSIYVKGQKIDNISKNYNLFVYNIDTTKNTVYRLTNAMSTNIKPVAVDDKSVFYISDQQGIYNLNKYNFENGVFNQVTNFGSSIKDYHLSSDLSMITFIMLQKEREQIYHIPFNPDQNIFTTQTKRQQFLNAKYVAQRLRKSRKTKLFENKDEEASETVDAPGTEEAKTVDEKPARTSFLDEHRKEISEDDPGLINPLNYSFDAPAVAQQPPVEAVKEAADEEIVDTDKYVFDTDVVKVEDQTRTSFLSNFRKLRKSGDISGPYPYETRFSADNIVTSFVIDPLIGFGLKLETQMNDILENHKFYGGILATTDLKSGSYYGEYRYLKNTVDFHGRFARRVIYKSTNEVGSNQKYALNTWEAGASLPLSVSSRVTLSPFFANTSFYDLDAYSVFQAPEPVINKVFYGGLKLEYIFDNTTVAGLNLIQGTRAKVGFSMYEGFNDGTKSFSNLYLDIRNYQKIHREMIFATRLFYGSYFGQNKQNYLLGGMDNWLFNSTVVRGEGDPLWTSPGVDNSNLLFVEYVTSLRGFDYSTFYGTNALLLNLELRFPVIKYFYRGPIASNFFRNLQFIGFYDMGSAWTGPSPFSTENSLNTEILEPEGNPFSAKIQNFKNPWLASYGFGVRTVLLGYYIKFDVAYPIEDLKRGSAKFYVTLGYDF